MNYRPNYHFSPSDGWMNDPNGLFYLDRVWHLYFQYYPHAPEHGPMHWGHATSRDFLHWEEQPIALFPDASRYIFSGSVVVDHDNTSGFGDGTRPPVVALYTAHDALKAKASGATALGTETQALAYSLDGGTTWAHYEGNPVLPNPGIRDFRDPKVIWDAERGRWVMVLAAQDRVHFYSSANLREWAFLSEFGAGLGAHGGVWECPDLFSMRVEQVHGEPPPPDAELKWVLLVSLNPGGPLGGSATQYFVGDFDGTHFRPEKKFSRPANRSGEAVPPVFVSRAPSRQALDIMRSPYAWLDWGRDNYASVLFNNAPDERRVMIGWMSNWDYAKKLPTAAAGWLGQMTIPRQLILANTAVSGYVLKCHPPEEIVGSFDPTRRIKRAGTLNFDGPLPKAGIAPIATLIESGQLDLTKAVITVKVRQMTPLGCYMFLLCNEDGEQLEITHHNGIPGTPVVINRKDSGDCEFSKKFAQPDAVAPITPIKEVGLHCSEANFMFVLDRTSVEVFLNGGERVVTSLVFPKSPYTMLLYSADVPDSTYAIDANEISL
ncbi:glycoside hydrolase family 32 protein [Cephaloticoccus primus]|nr:glycoside hydrolase family 32 protein [Cephaloticoccus primus]